MSSSSLKLNPQKEIPKGWNYKKLKDTGDFTNGLNKNKEDYGHGCLHVNIDDVFGSLIIDISKIGRVNATKEEIKRYCLKDGDLCLLRSSVKPDGIGYPSLFENSQVPVVFGGFLIRFKPHPDFWNSRYLTFLLRSKDVRKNVIAKSTFSANTNINQKAYGSIQVLIPTLQEQQKISELLLTVNDLIQSLDSFITKMKNIKLGAMQELLTGKRKLEGFNGKWTVEKLGKLGEPIIGLTYSPENINSEGILVLRSSNVFEGRLKFDDNVFVDMDIPDKIRVQKGDLLVCVRNGSRRLIGKCAFINKNFNDVAFGAFMSVFRSPYNDFIFQQFQSEGIKKQIAENLGATINQITNKVMNSFEILFPQDPDERDAISKILSDMDLEIQELESKRDKYIKVKNGMMQKLLTGEIRLV